MKIVYCIDSICYLGGIPRITIAKASALANIPDNEVWIVVTDHKKNLVLPINPKVHIVNLNINYYEDDWKGKWYVLKGIVYKRRLHKAKLQTALEQIQPDVVIATGTSEKNFITSIRVSSHPAFVREIHYHKHYRMASATTWFAKLLAIGGNFMDYHWHIHKYDKIVVLTDEDMQTNWKNNPKVCVIPNPLTEISEKRTTYQNKTVITAGRLSYPKNYPSLVRIWKSIHDKFPDWNLEIWGIGEYYAQLTAMIHDYNLQDCVFLKGYSPDVLSKMADASIFAMSSRFEGLPLVIIEAFSVGLPVVTYQCPYGPKYLISDKDDGFLVSLGDEQTFAERLSELMEDMNLRKQMGKKAIQKSQLFHIDKIAQSWMELFTNISHL